MGIKYDKYKPKSLVRKEIIRFLFMNHEHLFTIKDLKKWTKNELDDIQIVIDELESEGKVSVHFYKNQKMYKIVETNRIIIEPQKAKGPKEHIDSTTYFS